MGDKLLKKINIAILVQVVMAYFKVDYYSNIYIKGLRKTIKILSHDTQSADLDSNQSPSLPIRNIFLNLYITLLGILNMFIVKICKKKHHPG
jgi:hypothetical protein